MNCKNCGKELEFQGELCEECEAAQQENATATVAMVKTEEKKVGVKKGVLAFVFSLIAIFFASTAIGLLFAWEEVILPMLMQEAADKNATIVDLEFSNAIIGFSCLMEAVLALILCIPAFILSIAAFAAYGKSKKQQNPRGALVAFGIIALIFCVISVLMSFKAITPSLDYINAYLATL